MKKFTIDFFELMFLAEACIPPRPIARSIFWDRMIDIYYHQMTDEERQKALEWIQLNPSFDLSKPECQLFYNRYSALNQYIVDTEYNGKKHQYECFKIGDRYHTSESTSIETKYIKNIKQK